MPPVILANAREGQTREAFEARAGRPAPVAASATPSESCTHTVAAGDTLGQISADKLGTVQRWREIMTLNPGLKPNELRPGRVLKLPCSGGDGAGEGGAGTPPARATFLDRLRKAVSRREPGAPEGRATGQAGIAGGTVDALGLYDDNRDRRITCAEARRHGIAPVRRGHPAYHFMTDGDGDGIVCETRGEPDDAGPAEEENTAPPLPPPPVWTAKQGEFLADVLTRWGKTAGWTVIVDTTDAWRLAVAFRLQAGFEPAVAELIRGMGHDGVPPRVRLYPNNVLRLGGPL